jgi:hypothetical protein
VTARRMAGIRTQSGWLNSDAVDPDTLSPCGRGQD